MNNKNIYIEIKQKYHCIIFNLKKFQLVIRHGDETPIEFLGKNDFHYPVHMSEYQKNYRYTFSGLFY